MATSDLISREAAVREALDMYHTQQARRDAYRRQTGDMLGWMVLAPLVDLAQDMVQRLMELPETVGEWTGFYDLYSRKIYEGDVVRFERVLYRVEFWEGCWCLRPLLGDRPALVSKVFQRVAIVGTVYGPEVTGAAAE